MREATRVIRAGLTAARAGEPLHAGPVFAAPFHVPGDPAGVEYTYGRSHNPTFTELEQAIGLMEVDDGQEPAGVRVFGSGMAAVAAVFAAVLRPGDRVMVQPRSYFLAWQLLKEGYEPQGVKVERIADGEWHGVAESRPRLVLVESPSNPGMELVDLRRLADAAHAGGGWLMVDNTTATPLGQKPLLWGADFSVCSDSKAMCGHSDLMMGHVACLDRELVAKIDRQRTLTGAVPGPMEAWLMLRSLATLPLRLERMSANALAIARFLEARLPAGCVLYPGLKSDGEGALKQMRHRGPIVCFTLDGKEAAEAFFRASKLITEATSFGGMTTTAERRGRWGHDAVAPGFIRMSVGCEDLEDLLEDLEHALKAIL